MVIEESTLLCQVLVLLDAGAISVSPEGRLPCGASSWHRSVIFSFTESSWVLSCTRLPVLWLWWLVLMYPEGGRQVRKDRADVGWYKEC